MESLSNHEKTISNLILETKGCCFESKEMLLFVKIEMNKRKFVASMSRLIQFFTSVLVRHSNSIRLSTSHWFIYYKGKCLGQLWPLHKIDEKPRFYHNSSRHEHFGRGNGMHVSPTSSITPS